MLLGAIQSQILSYLYQGLMKLCINPSALTQTDRQESQNSKQIAPSNYITPKFYQKKAVQHVLSCILTFHENAHEQDLV